MTTIFQRNGQTDAASAGTHVLIIAVGGYPHLLGGDPNHPAQKMMGLGQLTSPPASAQALADWFLARQTGESQYGFYNPKAPLASIEMLVSPPWTADGKPASYSYMFANGNMITIEGAHRPQISTCYTTWLERVKANLNNIGVFYFCGHGITGLNDYVLAEDFGQDENNPWLGAIDITITARAARRDVKGALYFFLDTCRENKHEPCYPGAYAPPLHIVIPTQPVQCFTRLILWATGEGHSAYGAEGKPSRFTDALIQALSGFYGEKSPTSSGWVVSSIGLANAVHQILDRDNQRLEAYLHQHMEMECIGSHLFHYPEELPQIVATLSVAYTDPQIRQILDKLPRVDRLPLMIKETIAEKVESGRLKVEQLQQNIDEWLRTLTEYNLSSAQEPDREIAEMADKLLTSGKLNEARALFHQIALAAEARAVAEHKRAASYYASEANTLVLQMMWREAVPCLEKAISNAEQAHDDNSQPDMVLYLNNLGLAWANLGDYNRSIDCFNRALTIDKQLYVDKLHPNMADHLNNLSRSWACLGDYQKAIDYSSQALEMVKQIGDRSNPIMAIILNNLGGAWISLSNYDKAIHYFSQALSMNQQLYRDIPNPHVARDWNSLGQALVGKGKYTEAIECYKQAIVIARRFYHQGVHPDIATYLSNLSLALANHGDCDEAINYSKQALEMAQQLYGNNPHPNIAAYLNNLGVAWQYLHNYNEAASCFNQALTMAKQVYRDSPHPDIATYSGSLGTALASLGRYEEAIGYHEKTVAIERQVYGNRDHSELALSLNNLGLAWSGLGQYNKTIDYVSQALGMAQKIYGNTPHQRMARYLENLGMAYFSLGKYRKAISYYAKAMVIARQVYGHKAHPTLVSLLDSLGEAWSSLKDYSKAINFYSQALTMTRQIHHDRPHLDQAIYLKKLGVSWFNLGNVLKAIGYYNQALAIFEATLPKNDVRIIETYTNLHQAQKAQMASKKSGYRE